MALSIDLQVEDAPPAKDGGKSIRSADHPSATRVLSLRSAMAEYLKAGGQRIPEGASVRLQMHFQRATCRADALNLINGVADIIQRRSHHHTHAHDAWLLVDDDSIREFHYTEEASTKNRYSLRIESIGIPSTPPHSA